MNIYEIRRRRLRAVMDADFDGKQAAIAKRLDRQPDYISRLLSGKKKLSGDMAREYETLLGKQAGWLDTEQSAAARRAEETLAPYNDQEFQTLVAAWPKLTVQQRHDFVMEALATAEANRVIILEVGPNLNHVSDEKIEQHYRRPLEKPPKGRRIK